MNKQNYDAYNKIDQFDQFVTDLRSCKFKETIPEYNNCEEVPGQDQLLVQERTERCLDILDTRLIDGTLPWSPKNVSLVQLARTQIAEDFYNLQNIIVGLIKAWTVEGSYENSMISTYGACQEQPTAWEVK